MTRKPEWANFEEKVRGVAAHVWGRPCKPTRIGGVNLDGVVTLSPEIQIFIEITEERTLNKVRADVIKLQTAKASAFVSGIMGRCFCVIDGSVVDFREKLTRDFH